MVYLVYVVDVACIFLGVHEAGCGALKTQTFFLPNGTRLDVAGRLSTPPWGKPSVPT